MEADHDQMFRVLVNIARNAVQALEARGTRDPARDQNRITGRREGSVVVIEVSDTGPGVPEKARTTCSRRSRDRREPAERASASPLPRSLCGRMAAKSALCRARLAPPSASRSPTGLSISIPDAVSARAPDGRRPPLAVFFLKGSR